MYMPNLTPALQNTDSWLDYMNPPVPQYTLPWKVVLEPNDHEFHTVRSWCRENFGARWQEWSHNTPRIWVFRTQSQAVQFVLRWHGAMA